MTEKNTEKTLAQKVTEREWFVRKIVKFVAQTTREIGTLVKREESSSHTHTI